MKWATQSKLLRGLAVLGLFVSLFTPTSAFAAGNSLALACPGTIETSTTFNCSLSASSSSVIKAIYASFSITGAQLVSFSSSASTWSGALSGADFSAQNTSGQSGTISLGTITLKANASSGTAKIAFSNVYFADAANSEFTAGGVVANVSVTAPDVIISPSQNSSNNNSNSSNSNSSTDSQSSDQQSSSDSTNSSETSSSATKSDTSLKSLSITGYDIDFSPTTFTYNVQIDDDVDKLTISAEPTASEATYKITNNSELKDGSVVRITVTNGDAQSIYRLKIAKAGSESASTVPATTNTTSTGSSSATAIIIIVVALVLIGGLLAVYFFVIKKKTPNSPAPVSITPPPSVPMIQPPAPAVSPAPQPVAPAPTANPGDNPFINVPTAAAPAPSAPAPTPTDNPFMDTAPGNPVDSPFSPPSEPAPAPTETATFNFPTPPKAVEQAPSFSEASATVLETPTQAPPAAEPPVETVQEPVPPVANQAQPDEGQDPLVVNATPVPDSISTSNQIPQPTPSSTPAPTNAMPLVNMAAPQPPTPEPAVQPTQPLEPQTDLQAAMPAPEHPASEPFSLDSLPFNPTSGA